MKLINTVGTNFEEVSYQMIGSGRKAHLPQFDSPIGVTQQRTVELLLLQLDVWPYKDSWLYLI